VDNESLVIEVLGVTLIVLGTLFVVLGLYEAFRKVFPKSGGRPRLEDGTTDWVGIIADLIKLGLVNVGIGLFLIIVGLRMLGAEVFPPEDTSD
jgi:hypothetical protein